MYKLLYIFVSIEAASLTDLVSRLNVSYRNWSIEVQAIVIGIEGFLYGFGQQRRMQHNKT